jgi:DnaJ-class molecular chaperone
VPGDLYTSKSMTSLEEDKICTACEGTGNGPSYWFPANTKVVRANGDPPKCYYCGGTGERKEQVFNWMKDSAPEKYLKDKK